MRKNGWLKMLMIVALLISVTPAIGTASNEFTASAATTDGFDYDYVGIFSQGLAVVVKNGKYGYVNAEGKVVIPLTYDIDEDYGWLGQPFYDGLAKAYKNGKYGYIDTQGNVVVSFIYQDLGHFGDYQLAWAVKDHSYGFINRKGEVVIPFIYNYALNFVEDRALVVKGDKQGYIDLKGNEITNFKYDAHPGDWLEDYYFSDGMAKVLVDFKVGYIDQQGQLKIPVQYNLNSRGFSEGLAAVEQGTSSSLKYGYIDVTGKLKIPMKYDNALYFHEGLARIGARGYPNMKYGFVDKEGKEIVPPKYDDTWYFYEGMAWVASGRYPNSPKYGYINKQGVEVVPLIYDSAAHFSDGMAMVSKNVSNRLKYGFINKQGKEIIPLAYDEATNFSQGLAWVKQNNKWYIIDKTGTIVAGEVKGSYQYDEADVGSTVNLDYEQLNDITSVEDAVRVVEQAAQAMTLEQKASATGIDRITLFAEEAAARVNELPLYQSKVTLTELLIEDMTMTASQAKTAVEQVLKKRGIESQRELRAIHRIKIDTAGEPLEIEVEPELGLGVDQPIQIATDTVELTLIPAAITAEIDRSNPLSIKLEKVTSNTTSNQEHTAYKVTFNKAEFAETVRLSLPPVSGEPTYQTVMNAEGMPVTSKFNPATGLMFASITGSGIYAVKQNVKDFNDIQNKPKEMQEAIRYLASKGIINGTSDTKFSPDGSISRAEIAALVVRALGRLDPNANGGFKDVARSSWYYGAVGSAKRFGIINGYSDNTFKGNLTIPKVQIVAIAARTLEQEMGYKKPSSSNRYLTYADQTSIAEWARADIAMATRENLIVKRTDNKFNPNDNMTRGDAAIILKRMFDKIW